LPRICLMGLTHGEGVANMSDTECHQADIKEGGLFGAHTSESP